MATKKRESLAPKYSRFEWLKEREAEAREKGKIIVLRMENGREMIVEAIGANYAFVTERGFETKLGAAYIQQHFDSPEFWKVSSIDRRGVKAPSEAIEAVKGVNRMHGIKKLNTGGYIEASVTDPLDGSDRANNEYQREEA